MHDHEDCRQLYYSVLMGHISQADLSRLGLELQVCPTCCSDFYDAVRMAAKLLWLGARGEPLARSWIIGRFDWHTGEFHPSGQEWFEEPIEEPGFRIYLIAWVKTRYGIDHIRMGVFRDEEASDSPVVLFFKSHIMPAQIDSVFASIDHIGTGGYKRVMFTHSSEDDSWRVVYNCGVPEVQ